MWAYPRAPPLPSASATRGRDELPTRSAAGCDAPSDRTGSATAIRSFCAPPLLLGPVSVTGGISFIPDSNCGAYCVLAALVVGSSLSRDDYRGLLAWRQLRPRPVERAVARLGGRRLHARQIRLDQRVRVAFVAGHPLLRSTAGQAIFILGRVRGHVDFGRDPTRRDADGARRWRTRRGQGRQRRGRSRPAGCAAVIPRGAARGHRQSGRENRGPQQRATSTPAHPVNLCNTGCRDGARHSSGVLSALTHRRPQIRPSLPEFPWFSPALSRCDRPPSRRFPAPPGFGCPTYCTPPTRPPTTCSAGTTTTCCRPAVCRPTTAGSAASAVTTRSTSG